MSRSCLGPPETIIVVTADSSHIARSSRIFSRGPMRATSSTMRVGTAAANMTPDERDDKGRAYLPTFLGEATPIMAATKILETGQTETLRIPAIRDAGTYEFVCTFPGHWLIMYGQLVVTKDVDAYLKQNPIAAKPAAASNAAPAHTQHTH